MENSVELSRTPLTRTCDMLVVRRSQPSTLSLRNCATAQPQAEPVATVTLHSTNNIQGTLEKVLHRCPRVENRMATRAQCIDLTLRVTGKVE